MGRSDVDGMLSEISSRQVAEWMAYERVEGPLDGSLRDDVLAGIHEQLQLIARLTGAQFKQNPAPEPEHVPRPHELYELAKKQRSREENY